MHERQAALEFAKMIVGSLLVVLYLHELSSREYLTDPEKVTTACLLSIWHFGMSLLFPRAISIL